MTTEVVLFDVLATDSGHLIGVITLNDPKALNALSLRMCQLIANQLNKWQGDEQVVAVLFQGAGDKAFCAGGNIRNLYDSMRTNPPLPNPFAAEFFGCEYRLYRDMQFFTKPLILWANGIVMGGGMGLLAMCSHRIVTQSTRFAMPEISIGLFPDAAGSWFLQRVPAKMGLFLGLTGAQCNAADALFANLAEYACPSESYDEMINALKRANWQAAAHHETASSALAQIHQDAQLPESHLAKHWRLIQRLMNVGDIHAIDVALRSEDVQQRCAQDAWLMKAIETYQRGCPVSAALSFELFKRSKGLSLEQVLYMEANVALHCAHYPDFQEGVRALLIDKDKSPNWSRSLAQCDKAYIESHFKHAFGDGLHPFADWLDIKASAVRRVADGQFAIAD